MYIVLRCGLKSEKIHQQNDRIHLTFVGRLQLVKLLTDNVFSRQTAKVVVRKRIQVERV